MGNVSANAQDTRHHAHPRPSRRHDRDEPQQHLAGDQARRAHRYKDHNDVWHVDGAELARAFPVTPPIAQLAPQDAHPDALAAHKLALAEERIAELKERLEEMKRERDRAQAGEDAWKTQCEAVTRQLALPAP